MIVAGDGLKHLPSMFLQLLIHSLGRLLVVVCDWLGTQNYTYQRPFKIVGTCNQTGESIHEEECPVRWERQMI